MFNTTDLSARGLTHKMKWFSKYSRQRSVAGLEHPQAPLPRMQGKDLLVAIEKCLTRLISVREA